MQEVAPYAVTGEKDAVNADGSINAQQIDPSKLIALLTASLQELHDIVKGATGANKRATTTDQNHLMTNSAASIS